LIGRVKRSVLDALNYQTWVIFDTFFSVSNQVQSSPNALGFILVGEGYISRSDLYVGLREHEHAQEPLGQSLVKLGLLEAERLTDALAVQAHCARLPPGEILHLLGRTHDSRTPTWEELQQLADVIVFGEHDSTLYLGVTDARALKTLDGLSSIEGFDFAVFVVSEADYDQGHALLRGEEPDIKKDSSDLVQGRSTDAEAAPVQKEAEAVAPGDESEGGNQAVDQGIDSNVLDKAEPLILGHNMLEMGYYEASEALFEAQDLDGLGAVAASALRHFFTRTACIHWNAGVTRLLAKSSEGPLADGALEAVTNIDEPFYGPISDHEVGSCLANWLGFDDSLVILVTSWVFGDEILMLLGAHEAHEEPYGDLNDVSGLFQEVESALNVLNNAPTNG
jgi:hypothetical protein